MSKRKKPNDLHSLRQEWYDKLKAEGFEDIEDDKGRLKSWSSRFAHDRIMQLKEDQEAYNDLASRFLREYKFTKEIDKIIWEYHINGLSVRDITAVLKSTKIKTKNGGFWYKEMVGAVLKRLSEDMKEMYLSGYTERQNEQ